MKYLKSIFESDESYHKSLDTIIMSGLIYDLEEIGFSVKFHGNLLSGRLDKFSDPEEMGAFLHTIDEIPGLQYQIMFHSNRNTSHPKDIRDILIRILDEFQKSVDDQTTCKINSINFNESFIYRKQRVKSAHQIINKIEITGGNIMICNSNKK